jgi:hypothetical protein
MDKLPVFYLHGLAVGGPPIVDTLTAQDYSFNF